MQMNVGPSDRKLRMIAGIIVVLLGAFSKSSWGVIGVLPVATAMMSWCPAYTLLGISTCSVSKKG